MTPYKLVADAPSVPVSTPRPFAERARDALHALARALGRERPAAPPAPLPLTLPYHVARTIVVRRLPFGIRCIDGCVWVTQSGVRRDHVLEAGQEFIAAGRGDVVVHGLAPSRISVSGATRHPR